MILSKRNGILLSKTQNIILKILTKYPKEEDSTNPSYEIFPFCYLNLFKSQTFSYFSFSTAFLTVSTGTPSISETFSKSPIFLYALQMSCSVTSSVT